MPFVFDPLYLVFMLPGLLLTLYAQWKVKSAYSEAQLVPAPVGMTGAEVAARILRSSGVSGVGIEEGQGFLSDHYDPTARVLRLSPDVYHGQSLAAFGIAAHEAGHALQHGQGYLPLKFRTGILGFAALGGNLSWILLMAGLFLASAQLFLAGIVLFSGTVLFQLVTLPVEFDASSRARRLLRELNLVGPSEDREVGRVLNAAALTYVAATLTALLTLAYYVLQFMSLNSREET
jgi:Zn-dependent membrane protease YugP